MAKCEFCGREMLTSKGCSFTKVVLADGRKFKRMKNHKKQLIRTARPFSEQCGLIVSLKRLPSHQRIHS